MDDHPGVLHWCHDMSLAPTGKNMGEPLSILLYVPGKNLRPVREGFWERQWELWSWYGAHGVREVRANQPKAWRYMPSGPIRV
ncbi:hypothetical protein [Salipiger sp. PrR003]|uniref:hypothetical protein n=1 Tax=Salipiger sp. PrR003 TaxID=2706776 RepID=UPI0013DC82D0|nr:hypothetical protein [Salipiger sp. PrR003]NDV50194.1 hypothetical protein [Salipiger sp. PrR003]